MTLITNHLIVVGLIVESPEAPPSRRAASVTPQQSLQKQRYQEAEKSAPVAVEDWQEDFEREWQVMAGPRTDNTWNVDSAWQSSSLSLDQIEGHTSGRCGQKCVRFDAEFVREHKTCLRSVLAILEKVILATLWLQCLRS
jgi:hypothetical protein